MRSHPNLAPRPQICLIGGNGFYAAAGDVYKRQEKDIYVRYFDKPRINNYLRITIGTDEEMEKFLKFLTSFLKIQK